MYSAYSIPFKIKIYVYLLRIGRLTIDNCIGELLKLVRVLFKDSAVQYVIDVIREANAFKCTELERNYLLLYLPKQYIPGIQDFVLIEPINQDGLGLMSYKNRYYITYEDHVYELSQGEQHEKQNNVDTQSILKYGNQLIKKI
jgi:hypothetical protein